MGQHNGITPPARPLVSFTPMNMQEHENDIRAIVNTHMGSGGGNPSQWVVNAGLECFSRGFGEGFAAAARRVIDAVPPMQQAASLLFQHEALRMTETKTERVAEQEGESQAEAADAWLAGRPGIEIIPSESKGGAQWLAFFTAALSGTAASAGSADNVINFAREIADTAMQAGLER